MIDRKVNVVEDLDGKKTVFIHDILFNVGKAWWGWEMLSLWYYENKKRNEQSFQVGWPYSVTKHISCFWLYIDW